MEKLVNTMDIKGLTFKDMIFEADLQLDATLQNLAVGLPIYDITFEGSKPEVTFISRIIPKPFFKRMHVPLHVPPFAFPRINR